ncbi:amidohydrolase [Lentibacillus kapialis]|uniref:Amidohydrolase n=1 Tax=Lentibacillus kapialis TaxID=340214 RepID=A0A917PZA3_9BACI|nr:amidohydrolase [Lentibacillus kapialis]
MRKIYINGNFYTFDNMRPITQAVVVENGRITDMGSTGDMLLQWQNPGSETINLYGKTVTPGLIDSHMHLSITAEHFLNLDLTGVTSKQVMLEKIQTYAKTLKQGEWLLGRGWDENVFTDGGIPTIDELDHVSPATPLYIPRICSHAFLVNSKALEASHYHPLMSVPEGGTVVLDKQTEKPTGLLLESASQLITEYIPEKSYDQLKNALRKTMQFAISKGLTSVHTNDPHFLGGFNQTYQLYDALLNQEDLALRTNLLIDHDFLDDLKASGMYAGFGNDTLQIGAVKLFADGALGRRTALLSESYSDATGTYGEAMYDQETLFNMVQDARKLSMPIAVHTIGDQALENVLDILDQFPPVWYRDRIIHVQVLREALIKRLVEPSRIADIQPRFVPSDFPWVMERLGEKRSSLAYAWRTLQQAGVICAGGSDAPVEPINPLMGIHAAVTRRSPGEEHEGWNPREKLSMSEAFRLFTEMGAYPTNEENKKGTISRGKLADMTVYSHNPFKMEHPDELLETDVDMTIIGGAVK